MSKVTELAEAIIKANEAARAADPEDDGGSCNFDNVCIKLPRWKQEDIDKVIELSGTRITEPLSSNFWKGYRWVSTLAHGQAHRRTKMKEAACKVLREAGFDVDMYYQMD